MLGISCATLHYKPLGPSLRNRAMMELLDAKYTDAPFYDRVSCQGRRFCCGPRPCADAAAAHGADGNLEQAEHVEAASRASCLPVSIARHGNNAGESGMERGHNIHSACAGVLVSCGCDRLAQPVCAELAVGEHDGKRVLRGSAGGGAGAIRQSRDIQQRPGGAVYEQRIYRRADQTRHIDKHGRTRSGSIQYFRRAAVASVKYEDVYLKRYRNIPEAREGLSRYFEFYNTARHHQGLGYKKPMQIYFNEAGRTEQRRTEGMMDLITLAKT